MTGVSPRRRPARPERAADQGRGPVTAIRTPVGRPVGRVTARGPQRRDATSSTLSVGAFTLCGHISAYGRPVSGAMENRAAVFTNQPQAVEVYQAGTWWAGELLGWRHDANGACQVWVRVVLGGVEETAWTDLASLRLPERHLAVAAESGRSAYAPATQEMSVARHPSGRRARPADADASATAGLPMVRDLTVVPDLPAGGGRRTADETAQFASVGRRRAPELIDHATTGGRRSADETAQSASVGRRRAPETAESPAVGRRRAPETAESAPGGRRRAPEGAATASSVPGASGRHRASGETVRHRPVDTGLLPAAGTPGAPAGRPPVAASRPAVRAEEPAAPRKPGWTAPEGLEPELLTRPMRLSDHVPHARRPRADGSVRSV